MKAETDWKKEAMLLSRLNHNNIVKYEDTFRLLSKESLPHPCILTEYCEVMLLIYKAFIFKIFTFSMIKFIKYKHIFKTLF